ncbi:MAG: ABC transporter ATP-binding protein [Acidobacteriota bacterium]|nr:ABC transporter ATP-binding protein [Acidobacteriota bacterium]MDE3030804.1 ABC transporter ATP-binding protein [Acidobacteriota bacterium]MDE3092545.1 ABC transporter ATP-binding protein [Acidobacteriota bacterium]MDE3138378.1 ABC transporter ATP-binding protein [Acidobacteriota bacterium]MDE3147620.1 ABC transporter ATP-binding protein [Acidobacteriota bacterium]
MRVELKGITKRFGSFTANDQIDLVVEPGQIHCLLGENGAGKSTLMNVLFGLLRAEEGEILIDGTAVNFANSGDAVRHGIGMVHQHFMLVPVFTAAENVVLGFEPTRSFNRLDHKTANAQIHELSQKFGLEVDPDAVVENLSVGLQQRVEILKALSHDAELLILDEPTAVLTPQEIDALMEIMRSLARDGKSILFITHKLKEVRAVADVITVIRQGRVVDSVPPTESEGELASLMVGREVNLTVNKEVTPVGDVVLELRDVVVRDDRGLAVVNGVSLDVRAGEIVALAGVQGNGQTELAEAVAGLRRVESGTISLRGRDITNLSPREILDAGLGHVPEDRQRDGLVLSMSVADNLVLNTPRRAPFARRGTRNLTAVAANARDLVQRFDIRTSSIDATAGSLSGGNQQKVIVARELSRPLTCFMASQPTRGLDVGSIEYVHRQIVNQRNEGLGVFIISSELDEVVALGDRIAVMYAGKITGVVEPTTSREDIGLLMTGASVVDHV